MPGAETPVDLQQLGSTVGTPDVPMIDAGAQSRTTAAIIEASTQASGHQGRLCRRQAQLFHPELCACSGPADGFWSHAEWSPVPTRLFPARARPLSRWPEMVDNVIPYIGGEEEKSEQEPLKIWGHIENGAIVKAASPIVSAAVPARGRGGRPHRRRVRSSFDKKPSQRGDPRPLGCLQGPAAGVGAAQRAQTVP